MPKVYVYDSYDNKFFRYTLRENDPMPYSTDTTLRVREFRGSSKSNVLWTTPAAPTAAVSRWGTPSSASGRAATARRASTMRVWRSTWGSAALPQIAAKFTTPLCGPGRGVTWSRCR